MSESEPDTEPVDIERLVYQLVRGYVMGKLASKHELSWKQLSSEAQKTDYRQKKGKIAKDAFLAVRSRSGEDFASYFAGTLASVPHRLNPDQFVALARELQSDPERLRTLTLLALSANS